MIMQDIGDEKRALDAFRKALARHHPHPTREKVPELVRTLRKAKGRDIDGITEKWVPHFRLSYGPKQPVNLKPPTAFRDRGKPGASALLSGRIASLECTMKALLLAGAMLSRPETSPRSVVVTGNRASGKCEISYQQSVVNSQVGGNVTFGKRTLRSNDDRQLAASTIREMPAGACGRSAGRG